MECIPCHHMENEIIVVVKIIGTLIKGHVFFIWISKRGLSMSKNSKVPDYIIFIGYTFRSSVNLSVWGH